jgi:hypothetical protein
MECTQGHLVEVGSSDLLAELASQEGISDNLVRNTYWHQCSSLRPIRATDTRAFMEGQTLMQTNYHKMEFQCMYYSPWEEASWLLHILQQHCALPSLSAPGTPAKA